MTVDMTTRSRRRRAGRDVVSVFRSRVLRLGLRYGIMLGVASGAAGGGSSGGGDGRGRRAASSTGFAKMTTQAANPNPIRVLVAKPGLDGHDRGAKVIARALRDAGMEVIYTGIRQTPQMIAQAAAQEDVAVLGLSILSGAHMELMPEIMRLLGEQGMDDVLVVLGGIVPEEDREALGGMGVAAVFGPGTSTREIVDYIAANVGAANAGV